MLRSVSAQTWRPFVIIWQPNGLQPYWSEPELEEDSDTEKEAEAV